MNAYDKLIKARTLLILDHPFFGCLSMKLKLVERDSLQTAATDGKSIFFNNKFIESIAKLEVVGLLAHEIMHVALGHHWRQEDRRHDLW